MFRYNLFIKNTSIKPEKKVVDKILKEISDKVKIKQNWTLNIVFLDEESIKKLNDKYRNKNEITDVLSFHYFSDFSNLKPDEIAWEILFCEEKIKEQALYYGLWEEKEFYKLLIHSVFHILWYDHTEDNDYKMMNDLEKTIWQEVFEK